FKRVVGLIVIIIAIPYGMMALVFTHMGMNYFNCIVNMIYSGRLIAYNLFEQLKDISLIILSGSLCFIGSFYLRQLIINYTDNNILIIVTISISFLIVYVGLISILDKGIIKVIKN